MLTFRGRDFNISLRMRLSCGVFFFFAAALVAHAAIASEPPRTECAKIETLIAVVERLSDAVFVRNGRDYSAAAAAKFLRGKWKDRAADVHSAEDFIEKVATRSSTTGKPYLVYVTGHRQLATQSSRPGELHHAAKPAMLL